MQRILVRPEGLRALAETLDGVSGQLTQEMDRLSARVMALDWEGSERAPLEGRVEGARRLAATVATSAQSMSAFLRTRADLFLEADGRGLREMQQLGAQFQAAMAAAPVVDAFWSAVGAPPVVNGQFSPGFSQWAETLNARIRANWVKHPTDHVGTSGVENLMAVYGLTPVKVEQLWNFARDNHVDPRLLLAILEHEATGSFNTNSMNAVQFQEHGPQPDFTHDLEGALDGPILSKLRLYPHAVAGGFPGTWVEWVNWFTPMDTPDRKGWPGVYAADINWAAKVERCYRNIAATLGGEQGDPVQAYSAWMGEHPDLFQPKHVAGEFEIKQGLPPGVDRPNLAMWGEYPRPDFPGAERVGAWWWFPAPDEYCWHVVRK